MFVVGCQYDLCMYLSFICNISPFLFLRQAIEHIPFRGAPCSDAAGVQNDYQYCRQLLRLNATTGRLIDNRTGGAFFNYLSEHDRYIHQVWMDDPETLLIKYDLANDRQLFGIGMWNVDTLDYSENATKEVQQDTKDMWNAMERFRFVDRIN